MPHDVRKLCFDILKAVADIKSFTVGLDLDAYRNSRIVKLAVERDYEIFGEALKRMQIRFESKFSTLTDGRKIIDFRNLLAHAYDDIADEIVWDITNSNLATLQSEIEELLNNYK
ncbi:MAG: HepT-like ribonuclease domain-containing protein [Pyrinomonadaceae bacterium]